MDSALFIGLIRHVLQLGLGAAWTSVARWHQRSPGVGEIDLGETVQDGLDRELGEEIGSTISREKLQLTYTYTSMKENGNYVRLYFVGVLDSDQLTLSPEHDTLWWMSLDEAIEKNNHPTQNKFLRYIKDNQLLA
jgi:8-oxo-dGTP pyrophosphatase MutT (NUDIX family)